MQDAIILELVSEYRQEMPHLGTRKLHYLLQPDLKKHDITIGRDSLFDLLSDQGMLVRRRKRRVSTTNSRHRFRKYPNLIKDLLIDSSEQVWVSDITYIRLSHGFSYLSLLTDLHSRRIVGYHLGEDLSTKQSIKALNMAISQRIYTHNVIHHSDRGIQYCSNEYVSKLNKNMMGISMTQKSDPYENPVAERINGILKQEFGMGEIFRSHLQAAKAVEKAVQVYNSKRPHASCDYLTPDQAYGLQGALKRRWKNYYHQQQIIKANQEVAIRSEYY